MAYLEFELLDQYDNPRHVKMNDEDCNDLYVWRETKSKPSYWRKLKISTDSNGYKYIIINEKHYLLHRVNYYIHNPEWDIYDNSKNNLIDHIDRNRSNNHISNLRVANHSENHQNRDAKGYSYNKTTNKYHAQIKTNGIQKYLGCYDTPKEAREVYLKYKKEHHSYYVDKNNN